jgi:hypothetical protein
MADETAEVALSPLTEAESTELRSLETEMADTRGREYSDHWSTHYWHSEQKQARARELLDREATSGAMSPAADAEPAGRGDVAAPADRAAATEGEAWRSSPEQFAGASPKLAAEWGEAGDLPERLARAQDVAGAAVAGISDTEARADFEASFEGLPDGAQVAIIAEISMPEPGYVKEATDDDIELFASTEEGRALVGEWGGPNTRAAARNVGIVKGKLRAAMDEMSESDRQHFEVWFDNLASSEALSALRALTA